MLQECDVILLREKAHALGSLDYKKEALRYGCGVETLNKAVRGGSFKHLDALFAPFKKQISKPSLKLLARELYRGGMCYDEISDKLDVSKSSVSLWCRDLVIAKTKNDTQRCPIGKKKDHKSPVLCDGNKPVVLSSLPISVVLKDRPSLKRKKRISPVLKRKYRKHGS